MRVKEGCLWRRCSRIEARKERYEKARRKANDKEGGRREKPAKLMIRESRELTKCLVGIFLLCFGRLNTTEVVVYEISRDYKMLHSNTVITRVSRQGFVLTSRENLVVVRTFLQDSGIFMNDS